MIMTIKDSIQIYLEWKQTHTSSAYATYKIRLQQFEAFVRLSKTELLNNHTFQQTFVARGNSSKQNNMLDVLTF